MFPFDDVIMGDIEDMNCGSAFLEPNVGKEQRVKKHTIHHEQLSTQRNSNAMADRSIPNMTYSTVENCGQLLSCFDFSGTTPGNSSVAGHLADFRQDWGYVEIRDQAHMFYWLFYTTHARGVTESPLVIWLQVRRRQRNRLLLRQIDWTYLLSIPLSNKVCQHLTPILTHCKFSNVLFTNVKQLLIHICI